MASKHIKDSSGYASSHSTPPIASTLPSMDDSQLEVINKDKVGPLKDDPSYQLSPLEVINEEDDFKPILAMLDGRQCHKRFFFPDGDLVLMTPSVNFRVHIHRLRSTVLDSVFKTFEDDLKKSTSHFICMQTPRDSDSDWASFLGEIYNDNG